MGLPRHIPPGASSSGRGPFGEKAFRGALIGCVALVLVGALMVLLGGDAAAVGTAFIVLGVLGLVSGGAGLLAEHLLRRRPPPPTLPQRNGRGPRRPPPDRIQRLRRRP
jgi:hypothetical protein